MRFVYQGELLEGVVIGVGNGSTSPTGDPLCTVRVQGKPVPVAVRGSVFDSTPEEMLW